MELSTPLARQLLGQSLIERGAITNDQLRVALHEQKREYRLLGKILIELGFMSEGALREALGAQTGVQCVDLAHATIQAEALALLPEALVRQHRILPLEWNAPGQLLTIATAHPENIIAADQILACLPTRASVVQRLASESDILSALDRNYGSEPRIGSLIAELEAQSQRGGITHGNDGLSSPVSRLIDALLSEAVKRQASDIHFEPECHCLRIRFRIDGYLRQLYVLHTQCWPALAVRLKVMANLNIAESRCPQDGRITQEIRGRDIDIRIASFPTSHGENIVLRILDRQHGILSLTELGLGQTALQDMQLMLERPEGLLVVTGPTGSGKTTTLYSILSHLDSEHVNIMTLEDPIEYPMTRIRQTAISEASRIGFAEGVRALLRQDPDIILIGEIRDAETAEMAFRAAMTGHQVHATLHAGSALGALPRLAELGISPHVQAGNLIGIVAQRLVRRLCPVCRRARLPSPAERDLLGPHTPQFMHDPTGCPACEQQGYRGRLALVEILRVTPQLDELIGRGASRHELERAARLNGFVPLAEDGLRRVAEGSSTIDEVARIVDLTALRSRTHSAMPAD